VTSIRRKISVSLTSSAKDFTVRALNDD
jgi:hypothetical protein